MGKNKIIYFFDALIVLLNIATGRGNILLYWLTGLGSSGHIQALVIFFDIVYLLLRTKGLKGKTYVKVPSAAILMFVILLVNLLNIIIEGKTNPLAQTIHIVLCTLFIMILHKISNEYLSKPNRDLAPQMLSKGYVWLTFLSVAGIILSFVLMHVLGPRMDPVSADFLEANIDKGETYYRSYFSMNMFVLFGRVPFFQDYGMLCGLYHEPHTLAMGIFPCLILLLGFAKNNRMRWFLAIISALMILFAGSATNILVVAGCLLLYFIVNSKNNFWGTIVTAIVVVVAVVIYSRVDTTLLDFVYGRLDADSGSQQYSVSNLEWTFSPKTLMGSNFFATSYVKELMDSATITKDVGYIPMILYIIFLFCYLKDTIKLILSKNSVGMAVGFASLYLIAHSAKICMTLFGQTLPLLMIYLQALTLKLLWKKQAS